MTSSCQISLDGEPKTNKLRHNEILLFYVCNIFMLLALCEGIHWSTVDSHHKGQWREALVFSLICAWTNGRASTRYSGDSRRHLAHYDVIVLNLGYTFSFAMLFAIQCYNSGVLCQQYVSRAGTSNHIPQILWDVFTFPCPWYLLLAQHSSIDDALTKMKKKKVLRRHSTLKVFSTVRSHDLC